MARRQRQMCIRDSLADQSHVINTFVERIEEARLGMLSSNNDLMTSFKSRLERGEVRVHHHHAEYKPIVDPLDDEGSFSEHEHNHEHGHEHGHSHEHEHGHAHGHSHGIYEHIGHPNGPRTMIDQGVCCCFMSQFPQHIIDEERELLKQSENS